MTSLPPFAGATAWLNSEPLTLHALRGRVVLVNFWTLTCVNWLRQEPWVRAWSRAYRDDGLVVIGVHTPEFGFEHDIELIRRSLADREIDYPVAVDSDYAIWSAFDNHYWPALYFADRSGEIVDFHFGEGRYEKSERTLQRLLGVSRPLTVVEGAGPEKGADWDTVRTNETYLGRGSSTEGPVESPAYLPFNRWGLDGAWRIGREDIELTAPGGTIAFRFQARDANLVLSNPTGAPIPFRVLLDGAAPGASHGADTSADGTGVLDYGRMYQLIRQDGPVAERTVEILFERPGVRAYVFTFG
ncbi:thioredoxin [Actinoplanes sp. NPDC051411]|uniref:thioredoxin n=1 Tax=Actinoplanes sp. NPDC051411 TaxID=3155522 RepID=UPI0034443F63